LPPAEAQLKQLLAYKEDLQEKGEQLNAQMRNLAVSEGLFTYAAKLQEGKCPLCGSEEHPHPLKIEDISEVKIKLELEIKGLGKQISECEGLINQASGLLQKKEFYQQEIKKGEVKVLELNAAIEKHHTGFVWPAYKMDEPEKPRKEFERAEAIRKQIKEIEEKQDSLSLQIKKQESRLKDSEAKLAETKEACVKISSSIEVLQPFLKNIDARPFNGMPPEELASYAQGLEQQYQQLIKDYEKAQKELQGLEVQYASLLSAASGLKAAIEDITKNLDENRQLQLVRLATSGFTSIEEVKEILVLKLDMDKEKLEIENFKKLLHDATAESARLERETAGKVYKEDALLATKQELEKLKKERFELNSSFGSIKLEIGQLQQKLARRIELQDKQAMLQAKLDHLKIINSLLHGGKFVDYVSTIYLRNLCNTANHRFFKMTGQKLSLELNQGNEFIVRDYLNGGKTRSTKTLSGGQTFQAALSLALSLSQGVQPKSTTGKGFFFIDDGFGSLDKEALTVVFDTLKSLKQENRIVGVISHVEALQQEINVYLKVENSEKDGSRILESWKS
jgi:DNA repair protein SbcC/Rad50